MIAYNKPSLCIVALLLLRPLLGLLLLILHCCRHEVFCVGNALHPHLLRNVKNLLASFGFLEREFEVGIGDPWCGQIGKFLAVFLIDNPHAVQLAEMFLHFYVSLEDLLLGVEPYGSAEDLPRLLKVIAPETEVGVKDPQFAKGELLMRHQFDSPFVDLFCPGHIFGSFLFKNGVVEPQIHVSSPEALLFSRRLDGYRRFVDFPHPIDIACGLLQEDQVQPSIIVQTVPGDEILVDISALAKNDLIDVLLRAVLLLEVEVQLIEFGGLVLGEMSESEFEDLPCPVILPLLYFKFGEIQKVGLGYRIRSQFCHHALVRFACGVAVPVSELELGDLEIGIEVGVGLQIAVEYVFGVLGLAHPLLKLDEGHPGLFAGAPVHPPSEDISGLQVISYQFLHVGVFEPELVLPREVVDRPFPHVPRMVHELVLHLHLCVLQPQTLIRVVDFESPFEDGPGPGELLEALLPLRVPHPDGKVVALPPEFVLELSPFLLLVDVQFLLVHYALHGRAQRDRPVDLCVFEDLVCRDLHQRCLPVLYGRRLHLNHRHGSYKLFVQPCIPILQHNAGICSLASAQ